MKKQLLRGAACLLCGLLLAGCLGEGSGLQGGTVVPPAPSQSASAPAQPQPAGPLRLLLPAGLEGMTALLEQMATAAGLQLEIEKVRSGALYIEDVQAALQGGAAPDLVWLNNQADFLALDGPTLFENLLTTGAGPTLQALAQAVPEKLRFEADGSKDGEDAVYMLPAGANAQGYLVNMDLLATLLNAQNRQYLLDDLMSCSYRQWRMLVISIEQYLQKPGRIQITLGDTNYITPALRPEQARALRGIFALPDADADALLAGVFTAAFNPPFEGAMGVLEAGEEEKTALLYPMLGSLMSHLEFETKHMTRREGVVFRGQAYADAWEKLAPEAAQQLFTDGVALFYRADAHTGLRLEAQHPQLQGNLALVPVKLPLIAREEADPEAEDDESAPASGEGTAPLPWQQVDVMERLAQHNVRLWVSGGGGFALVAASPNGAQAQALLQQLFATQAGYIGLLGLGLVPFAPFVLGGGLLQNQLNAALAGPTGAPLPVQPGAWINAQTLMGEFVRDELMDKDEWEAEEIDAFFHSSAAVLGLRLESLPELEDGEPLVFEEEEEPAPAQPPDEGDASGTGTPASG